jgi:hypothetical protein
MPSNTTNTITAYHGTAQTISGTPIASLSGTFGAGVYWGNFNCAKEYAHHALFQVEIPLSSLLRCAADYDVAERFDLDTPALPLLMQLFSDTEDQAAARFSRLTTDGFHLGEEIGVEVKALGFDGLLAEYEPGVFEVVWFGEPLPMTQVQMAA